MRALTACALVVTACALTAPLQADTAAFAIVIGNNAPPAGEPAAGLAPLRFADDDAVRYFQLFERLTRQAQLLTVLDDETQRRYPELAARALPPDAAHLTRAVQQLRGEIAAARAHGDEAVLYFIFSGHGAVGPDGQAYLALLDGALGRAQLLAQVLEPLAADYSHLLIDACHAGGVVGVRGMFEREVDARRVDVSADERLRLLEAQSLARLPGVGAVIATTAGEEAHEWSRLQAGVFSHELLSGLLGAADVNADGSIDYLEIQAFVAAANRDVQDPRAVPQVIAMPPRRNRSVALVRLDALRDTVFLRGDPGPLGHFHIELANGQRYLDGHLQGFRDHRLALPANSTLFLRTASQEAELTTGAAGELALAALALGPSPSSARGSLDAAYRAALFASPFSATYYRGYLDSLRARAPDAAAPTGSATRAPPAPDGIAWPVIAGASAAAVGVLGVGVSAVLAGVFYAQYSATDEQRPAYEANQRFTWSVVAAAASAGVAAVGTLFTLGALWWPDEAPP